MVCPILYTPSVIQESVLVNQIVKRVPTQLQYVERSVFMQKVKNQKVWHFQIGTQEGVNIPIFIIIGFQQQDRGNSQKFNSDTFCRLPVTSAQCNIGTETYPDSAILLNYVDDNYLQ